MKSTIGKIEELKVFQGCILTYGHFSTIHPGHIRYLRHARGLGEKLVVALIGDETSETYPFKQEERAEAVSLLGIADSVLLLKSDELDAVIRELRPAVLVLGNEYKHKDDIQAIVNKQESQGGTIQFHAGDIHYATTDLLTGSESDIRQQRRAEFKKACQRQGIKKIDLLNSIKSWGKTRLIVLGDTIEDQNAA